jgi:outer membrane protein TolC
MKSLTGILFAACFCAGPLFSQNGARGSGPPVSFQDSPRVRELMRAGNLYLSLPDALGLAIENNLDVELQRYALPGADAELLRAKGGGVVRGLNYTLAEVPTGVGGPLSPLETSAAAAGSATAGASVATNALELGVLGSPQTNLSVQGTVPQSSGTEIPSYDRAIAGQLNWTHQTAPQVSPLSAGAAGLVTDTTLANAGIQQGFSSGAQAGLSFSNNRQWVNSVVTQYNPFTGSSLGLTVTQPLLRGFGASVNRRFIRIAGNERKIASLLFRQQLIATVYGVIRLYTDFVALVEDEKVKEETTALAEKLLRDVTVQVDEGTLAQVEKTRATAQVFSTRQDAINARGLREEQEAILRNVITRGSGDPEVRSARIIPTGALSIPENDEVRPVEDLVDEALANRPDLGQARLQIEDARIGLSGARNATLPQVDLVGVLQNSGGAGAANPFAPAPGATFLNGYGGALGQILTREYPTYGVGLQVNIPLHNRVAEADLARDEIQVKQSQIRLRQFENQARLEVEDALIAIRRARSSFEAAEQARKFQEESLAAEQAKFEAGESTSFFVIQYESMVAQARSTEVAARSSYVKARAALSRATGGILDENHISFETALKRTAR